jgi:disulfide bond formation protein DsbB
MRAFARTWRHPYIDAMHIPARLYPALIAAASVAVLAAAFGFQYLGGLDPCVLCVYQRYPYGVVIALAAVALVAPAGRARAVPLGLAAAAFVAGAGIAGFHVGVEQHWWAGLAACGGTAPAAAQDLNALMKSLARPPASCDAVAWSLFGISMAGYNFLISLALAALSIGAARRLWSARA